MSSKKREAQLEAMWGPGGSVAVYHAAHGRKANRTFRKDAVERRLTNLMSALKDRHGDDIDLDEELNFLMKGSSDGSAKTKT